MSDGLFTTITGLERKNWRGGFKCFRCKLISIDPPPIQDQDLTQPSNSN